MASTVLPPTHHPFHLDALSETSSSSVPTTPAPPEDDQEQKPTASCTCAAEDYAAAEHVAAWLPLDDHPTTKDYGGTDVLIDAIPPLLPAKATRLPTPSTLWKTWESPWANDTIWTSSRRFSTAFAPSPIRSTPSRNTTPPHRRSSFPDTVLATDTTRCKDYLSSLVSGDLDRPMQSKADPACRRYSAPSTTTTTTTTATTTTCHPPQQPPLSPELMQRIDDYFSSTPSSTLITRFSNSTLPVAALSSTLPSMMSANEVQHMGKGVPLRQLLHDDTVTLFTVGLAPGRQDVYYMRGDGDEAVKEGDLVIVEADRGQDIGRVQGKYAKKHDGSDGDGSDEDDEGGAAASACVRRLYRVATEAEVATLPAKAQDEAKALVVCQNKIRERQLPMQVLRAEYQWDRRKLTFHFTAEERVDFRELVRELFKLYKTRIWMCAIKHHPHA